MPRDSAAADRPASYLVGTAAAFPLFFRDRTKPINQLPFSPSAKFPKSGSSCESRVNLCLGEGLPAHYFHSGVIRTGIQPKRSGRLSRVRGGRASQLEAKTRRQTGPRQTLS